MPKKILCALVLLLFVALNNGCSVPQPKAKTLKIKENQSTAITYPAELRGAYFLERQGALFVCAEPAPDTALEALQKISANLSANISGAGEGSVAFASELSTKVIELAGRTELLLIARELLYRSCELSLNSSIPYQDILELHIRVADLIESLSATERVRAESELNFSEAERQREIRALENARRVFEGDEDEDDD